MTRRARPWETWAAALLAASLGALPAVAQHGDDGAQAAQSADAPSGASYVRQLKAEPTADVLRRGYDAFVNDLKAVDRSPARMREMETAPPAGREVGLSLPLANPPEIRADEDGVIDETLKVDFGEAKIFNIKEGKTLTLKMRSYNGGLFGPTLRLKPGQQLRALIDNKLPRLKEGGPSNQQPVFNVTNLHTHGLQVSPAGNSDNVLIAVPPQTSFQNEIHIGRKHPAGTFWYHAHVHGSTAIQVSSGMAGVLIVEGGLDDIPEIEKAAEKIMLFQQIPYVENPDDPGAYMIRYDSADNEVAGLAWARGVTDRGWRTTINGQTQPIVAMRPGEVQRWRMIHAGLREAIDVSLVPFADALKMFESHADQLRAQGLADNAPADEERIGLKAIQTRTRELLTKAPKLCEIAADGLAYGFAWPRKSIELHPGYRSDVLVKINDPGVYVIVDNEAPKNNSLWNIYEAPKVLGFVFVGGDPNPMKMPSKEQLARLRPHESITDDEVADSPEKPDHAEKAQKAEKAPAKRTQEVIFNISPKGFTINDHSYDPNAEPRTLQLGKAYEWELKSERFNHPFHIHVNPFEIIEWSYTEANGGKTISRLPVIDGKPRTIWKDTILTRAPDGDVEKETLRTRARNETYIGRFVLHCHILDHEDAGMMQDVEILPPGSAHH